MDFYSQMLLNGIFISMYYTVKAKRNKLGKLGKKEANKVLWKNSDDRIRQIYINLSEDIAPL